VRDTWKHVVNTEINTWDTSFGHINPHLRYPCGEVVFCVNLDTFFTFWDGGSRASTSTLSECGVNVL
jgi:hypothetical protein